MQHFVLCPHGYGQLGEATVVDPGSREIVRLSVMLDHPPTDDLMSVAGNNYLVASGLAKALVSSSLTGCALSAAKLYWSPQFGIWYPVPQRKIPEFKWLRITGIGLKNDFGIHQNHLVVSQRALDFLKGFRIEECEIVPVEKFAFSWEERKEQLLARMRQQAEEMLAKERRLDDPD